jgi:hypothetical protein
VEVEPEELIRKVELYTRKSSEFVPIGDIVSIIDGFRPEQVVPTYTIHGDFWPPNVIIGKEGAVWVTDYSECESGEPALDAIQLVSSFAPSFLLKKAELGRFLGDFLPSTMNYTFFILYFLVRKIYRQIENKRKLYEELLLADFEQSLTEIVEIGVLRNVILHLFL